MQKIKIAIDAMGGDFAPKNEVFGVKNLLNNPNYSDLDFIFVGDQEQIEKYATEANLDKTRYSTKHTTEVIEFTDNPTDTYRTKPNASMPLGFSLVKAGEADGFISGGNTGAMLTGAVLVLGRIAGIKRPAIGTWLPASNKLGKSFILDVGATIDMNSRYLYEYAVMGSTFVNLTEEIASPTIGLLNIGSEANKGSDIHKETYKILQESDLNFHGNIEGGDIFAGTTDVVVCDGYTGNVALKLAESFPKLLKSSLRSYADQGIAKKLKTGIAKPVLKEVLSGLDYEKFGGVPILGCNGIAMVCHGKSSSLAYESAIINTYRLKKSMFLESIKKYFE